MLLLMARPFTGVHCFGENDFVKIVRLLQKSETNSSNHNPVGVFVGKFFSRLAGCAFSEKVHEYCENKIALVCEESGYKLHMQLHKPELMAAFSMLTSLQTKIPVGPRDALFYFRLADVSNKWLTSKEISALLTREKEFPLAELKDGKLPQGQKVDREKSLFEQKQHVLDLTIAHWPPIIAFLKECEHVFCSSFVIVEDSLINLPDQISIFSDEKKTKLLVTERKKAWIKQIVRSRVYSFSQVNVLCALRFQTLLQPGCALNAVVLRIVQLKFFQYGHLHQIQTEQLKLFPWTYCLPVTIPSQRYLEIERWLLTKRSRYPQPRDFEFEDD